MKLFEYLRSPVFFSSLPLKNIWAYCGHVSIWRDPRCSPTLCVFGLMARRSAKIPCHRAVEPMGTVKTLNTGGSDPTTYLQKCVHIYIIAQIYAIRIISYYIILYHIISIILCFSDTCSLHHEACEACTWHVMLITKSWKRPIKPSVKNIKPTLK